MTYILIIGMFLLSLFSLNKDWHTYKPWKRVIVFVVLLLVGAINIYKSHQDTKDAQIAKTKAQNDATALRTEIAGLQGQVKAANDAQTQNTKVFLDNLNRLSLKVGDLQTEVTTEDLRKQLKGVQNDLQKTQKAMAPGPKAKLLFSFTPPLDSGSGPGPITETTLPVDSDGVVHISFELLNLTDVTATDGEINLGIICRMCKYAREPAKFRKLPGMFETERDLLFERLLPQSFLHEMIEVIVPEPVGIVGISLTYRCRSCVIENAPLKGIVHVARPFVRPNVVLPKPNKRI
jgi:hypothetical protein